MVVWSYIAHVSGFGSSWLLILGPQQSLVKSEPVEANLAIQWLWEIWNTKCVKLVTSGSLCLLISMAWLESEATYGWANAQASLRTPPVDLITLVVVVFCNESVKTSIRILADPWRPFYCKRLGEYCMFRLGVPERNLGLHTAQYRHMGKSSGP